ncbi:ABC transporter permease [Vallitalea sp.]|jgi:putative aldouronate transport system permease protein|uniref:ABC transporter permease n=1 Tax=Vallitalea sp. TaxID=1882829 RepID=UPI0025DEE720|nr:ABC transporter permease subunit [Vallitalea sp.]MCT4687663.1 ABC transporter permease subunit [Vallitalea sp.]
MNETTLINKDISYKKKIKNKNKKKNDKLRQMLKQYQLYLFLLPAIIYVIVFLYAPMYGILVAFKDYKPRIGILHSEWVGLKNFRIFFNSYSSKLIIKNTLILSIYKIIAGFPLPIILAILLHHLPSKKFKKVVQMATYAPYFISTVVIIGMINILLAPDTGILNVILTSLGKESVFFMGKPEYFRHIYVWSDVWQTLGWSSVIYIAALSSVDPTYYEAAIVDGATLFQRIRYIDLPSIMPTAIILLILAVGQTLSIGFEKVYLMQNSSNIHISEIISTYVYRIGILKSNFELGTAVDLFNGIINCILLISVNKISRKYTDASLF